MTLWLLLPAAVFLGLALDAWRMGSSSGDRPYVVEARERGESVAGVSAEEQGRRQAWIRRHGLGRPDAIVWLWLILALGCLLGVWLG